MNWNHKLVLGTVNVLEAARHSGSLRVVVPDTIRAFTADRPVRLRSPRAIRPWQHVLEPLRGYLTLAECMMTVAWYQANARGQEMREFTRSQITEYEASVKAGIDAAIPVKAGSVHA
jgi:hypothetical protein